MVDIKRAVYEVKKLQSALPNNSALLRTRVFDKLNTT